MRASHLSLVRLRRTWAALSPLWQFWNLRRALEPSHCIHDPPSPDCRTSNPDYQFPQHTSVEVYLNSDSNTHCSAPLLTASIKLNMAVWSPQILHIFHLQLINHLDTSMGPLLPILKTNISVLTLFQVSKFQNQLESPFTIMTLLQNLFIFNSLKAQPRIWKPKLHSSGLENPLLKCVVGYLLLLC